MPGEDWSAESSVPQAAHEFTKDATGVGCVWRGATELVCDYMQTHAHALFGGAVGGDVGGAVGGSEHITARGLTAGGRVEYGSVLELGAGAGVPGLLAACLGARQV